MGDGLLLSSPPPSVLSVVILGGRFGLGLGGGGFGPPLLKKSLTLANFSS